MNKNTSTNSALSRLRSGFHLGGKYLPRQESHARQQAECFGGWKPRKKNETIIKTLRDEWNDSLSRK